MRVISMLLLLIIVVMMPIVASAKKIITDDPDGYVIVTPDGQKQLILMVVLLPKEGWLVTDEKGIQTEHTLATRVYTQDGELVPYGDKGDKLCLRPSFSYGPGKTIAEVDGLSLNGVKFCK